jgi:hypothetical protein
MYSDCFTNPLGTPGSISWSPITGDQPGTYWDDMNGITSWGGVDIPTQAGDYWSTTTSGNDQAFADQWTVGQTGGIGWWVPRLDQDPVDGTVGTAYEVGRLSNGSSNGQIVGSFPTVTPGAGEYVRVSVKVYYNDATAESNNNRATVGIVDSSLANQPSVKAGVDYPDFGAYYAVTAQPAGTFGGAYAMQSWGGDADNGALHQIAGFRSGNQDGSRTVGTWDTENTLFGYVEDDETDPNSNCSIIVMEFDPENDEIRTFADDGYKVTGQDPNSGDWIVEAGRGLELVDVQTNDLGLTSIDGIYLANHNGKPWFGAYHFDDVCVEVVPEPATMSLLALGGLALIRRKR